MNKNELLEHIVGFYLTSGDFNGIPMYRLQNYNPKDMVELINDGLVETISESEAINPHIKGFEFALTTEQHGLCTGLRLDRKPRHQPCRIG